MKITCSNNQVLIIYSLKIVLFQPISPFYIIDKIFNKKITLKEYEIYLKVKKFIETKDCDENDIIPKLTNRIEIIPPLIIESDDMERTKYYSLSAAVRGCGLLKQMIIYAYRNRCTRIARIKGGSKVFMIEWLALPRSAVN